MARPKKIEVIEEQLELPIVQEVEDSCLAPTEKRVLFTRDNEGFLSGLKYNFKSNGFIDWRSMISTENIVLNKENFLRKSNPIDVTQLDDDEIEKLKSKAQDKDILIKLSGYRELAQIRGFKSCITDVKFHSDLNLAQADCKIQWLPNYETFGHSVESNGCADACPENTNGFSSKYLCAIAENRAFARAVRSFLQINIVSQDELKTETPQDFEEANYNAPLSGPQGALARKLKDSKRSFNELSQFALVKYSGNVTNAENWDDVKDINAQDATFLLSKFSEFLNRE